MSLTDKQPVIPPPLQKGDTIGICAPAGPIRNLDDFSAGLDIIQQMGFKPLLNKEIIPQPDHSVYLADNDCNRCNDFDTLWRNPEVKAIMALRGGFGSMRIVDKINYQAIRKRPKIFIGFSDITVLLSAINKKSGIIPLHGPVLSSLAKIDTESLNSLQKALLGQQNELKNKENIILKGGSARGHLLPGNLTTLLHLLRTPWEPQWQQAILMIEDVGEPLYKLDRMITQLHHSGILSKISALIMGTFSDNKNNPIAAKKDFIARILAISEPYNYPIWADFPFGHTSKNITIPHGRQAILDSKKNTIVFL